VASRSEGGVVFINATQKTTPTFTNAKATPPQEGNLLSDLKFPSRGGVPALAGGVVFELLAMTKYYT